ncbi:unnamed protein product [Victoria cruziana]
MTIIYRRWIRGVKSKLLRFHRRRLDGSNEDQEIVQSLKTEKVKGMDEEEDGAATEMRWALQQAMDLLFSEEMATIEIQACFRGHLVSPTYDILFTNLYMYKVVISYPESAPS